MRKGQWDTRTPWIFQVRRVPYPKWYWQATELQIHWGAPGHKLRVLWDIWPHKTNGNRTCFWWGECAQPEGNFQKMNFKRALLCHVVIVVISPPHVAPTFTPPHRHSPRQQAFTNPPPPTTDRHSFISNSCKLICCSEVSALRFQANSIWSSSASCFNKS